MPDASLADVALDRTLIARLTPALAKDLLAEAAGIVELLRLQATTAPATTVVRPSMSMLTVAEVAARTRLAKAYIYELVRLGQLRAVRTGRLVRVREDTLAAWLDNKEKEVERAVPQVLQFPRRRKVP